MDMNTIEQWCLRCADKDSTWMGLSWLRPAKDTRVGAGYVLMSSLLLGIPGIALGAGAIYLALGMVEMKVWAFLFALVMAVEIGLHAVFAYAWNRRASRLQAYGHKG